MQENNKENNIGQQGNMEDQAGTTDDDINENYSKNDNKVVNNCNIIKDNDYNNENITENNNNLNNKAIILYHNSIV